MKKYIFILFIACIAKIGFTQAPPQGVNYQAVVYSDNGNNQPGLNVPGQVLRNKNIRVRFSILQNQATGNEVYKEFHTTTTDAFGMFSLVIGGGTQESLNAFSMINWAAGKHFLKVEIDKNGGTNYVTMSNQQLLSVPYALYSDKSTYATSAGNGIVSVSDNGNGSLTFTYTDESTYTTPILTGLQGSQGATGAQGPAGQNGQDGANGANGQNGLSAYEIWLAQGNTGTEQDFLTAITGAQGIQGIQGVAGQNGQDGANGANGQNGLSAYEIWLAQGNTGTEQDFLTAIKGEQGETGTGLNILNTLNSTLELPSSGNSGDAYLINGDLYVWSQNSNSWNNAGNVQGPQGVPGQNGTNGQNGLSAYQVWLAQGNSGTEQDYLNAITGPQGAQGVPGQNGTNGQNGLSAYQVWLAQGNSGTEQDYLNAITGPQGAQGPQGVPGQNGTNGQNGLSAYQVWLAQGNSGTEQDYLNAITGPQGAQGVPGQNGTNGQNGLSAYQVWLAQGNSGTEQDYLNAITGPQGAQGLQGPQGLVGQNGTNGQNGLSAYQVWLAQGNSGTEQDYLNAVTGPQGAQGLQGPQGVPGQNGTNGQNGLSAYQVWLSQGNSGTEQDYLNAITGPQGNGFTNGTATNQIMYWNGSAWTTLNPGSNGQTLTICEGVLTWTTGGQCPGTLGALNCSSPVNNGQLLSFESVSGVTSTISYSGGNGGSYASQSFTSTGVLGLTANLNAGSLNNGNGNLIFNITGTPTSSGTAIFSINVGGQNCSLSIEVNAGVTEQYSSGSVFCSSGPTAIVDVTNPTTGKTWMDRNLGASRASTSSSDAQAFGDLYQWGRKPDGHQCRNSNTTSILSSASQPNHGDFILTNSSPFNWLSAENNNLWQGTNGINNPCPNGYRLPTESELNAERLSWSSSNAAGAFGSNLKWPAGGFRNMTDGTIGNAGTGGDYWSSTISGNIAKDFRFDAGIAQFGNDGKSFGRAVRCIKESTTPTGSIGSINCGGATTSGSLIENTNVQNVNTSITYISGNGGSYAGQTVNSTGVLGLTATLSPGMFVVGSGTLNFAITGTPTTSGTASFAINIGSQSCILNLTILSSLASQYPTGSVFCTSGPTAIVDVTNPITGKTWMDRNLGATQVATSSTDAASYGDLYQWGRRSDGHQCRNSATTSTLSGTETPPHGNFILAPNSPNDWRNPQNTNLWQGVNGINHPCPSGYRLPTETELNAERLSWSTNNVAGAFASPLKMPVAGYRNFSNGSIGDVGTVGNYWSSTVSNSNSRSLDFISSLADMDTDNRANGLSVRCIKESITPSGAIGSINCGGATTSSSLIENTNAQNVNTSITYTSGNGGSYAGQTVNSAGVLGLTATLSPGMFEVGSGTLNFAITGTPTTSGTASFAINIGGQSCNLELTVNPNLVLGYSYQGGIIFYILQPSDPGYEANVIHGLISAPYDQGGAPWGCGSTFIPTNSGIGFGNSNTNAILNGCYEPNIAAALCANLNLNGYDDWYLPTINELQKLYENRSFVGTFHEGYYWSSTGANTTQAWALRFSNTSPLSGGMNKPSTYEVRAIRSF